MKLADHAAEHEAAIRKEWLPVVERLRKQGIDVIDMSVNTRVERDNKEADYWDRQADKVSEPGLIIEYRKRAVKAREE